MKIIMRNRANFDYWLLLQVLWIVVVFTEQQCPPTTIISPCVCELLDITVIRCGGHNNLHLLSIFRNMSNYYSPKKQHFGIFYLNNTSIKTIPAFVFQNITFRHIYFDGAILLKYIDRNAFIGTENEIEFVNAWNTDLEMYRLPNDNEAFNSLKNLKYLDIAEQMYCPPEQRIKPCYCKIGMSAIGSHYISKRNSYSIYCDQTEPYYMRQIFQRITAEQPVCGTHFDNLYIDNHLWTNHTYIPENAFADVTFANIYLQWCEQCNQYKLHIDPKAFGKTRSYVQSLSFASNLDPISEEFRQTFIAINSLPNLRNITISAGFDLLPSHSFRNIKWSESEQTKLKTVSIKSGKLEKIGSYAFYPLSNLDLIDLSHNSIDSIETHAFAFRDSSFNSLLIDLSANPIHSMTFNFGAFSRALRPIELILATHRTQCSPQFQFLSEDIFAPLFACGTDNRLQLGACSLVCDCNMKWLVDAPQHWRLQIIGGHDLRVGFVSCTDGKSLFDRKPQDFGDCTPECDPKLIQTNVHKTVICKTTGNSSASSK